MALQGIPNGQNNLEKEYNWQTLTSWLRNLLQAIIIKRIWYWHQWNESESSEINQVSTVNLFLIRPFNGERIVSLMNGTRTSWYSHAKEWS